MTDVQLGEANFPQTILIVEDEETQLDVLSRHLSQAGYKILTAKNGAEGLQSATDNRPDLILLDNRMETMTGYEMLKRLRNAGDWGAAVPVIFLTNIEMKDEAESNDIADIRPAYYLVKSDTDLGSITEKIKSLLH